MEGMKYRPRWLERKLLRYHARFPIVLLLGARQVGKSTLLHRLFGRRSRRVVFDPVIDVGRAREDPEFFLEQHPPPIILDEVQYAPELLSVLKRRVDEHPVPGQYLLTGSQNPAMMKTVSESLAGRAVVLELDPMSLGERLGLAAGRRLSWLEAVLRSKTAMPALSARRRAPKPPLLPTLFAVLWRGGFPGTLDLPDDVLPDFFLSYLHTYIERDVRNLADVSDQQTFSRFVGLCAALTGCEINHSQLGREIGITPQTAARWLAILKATYQWIELPPYSGNALKRLSGKPKGYLTDTGLAAALQRISSSEALASHPQLGALFETHVVLELHHHATALSTPPQWYHWRAHGGAEVDVILERDGVFWPIEITCASRVSPADASGIQAFRATYPRLRIGPGLIIAPVDRPHELPNRILVLPYDLL